MDDHHVVVDLQSSNALTSVEQQRPDGAPSTHQQQEEEAAAESTNRNNNDVNGDNSSQVAVLELLIGQDYAKPKRIQSSHPNEFGFHTHNNNNNNNRLTQTIKSNPIYTKNIKWSPDGLVLLSNSDDNVLRLFELSSELFPERSSSSLLATSNDNDDNNNCDPTNESWQSCLRARESGPIYDFDWYPLMNSQNPSTCFFIAASCSQPIHMWDAFTGQLLHSFECLDRGEELISPISTSFNASGSKIYCGLNKSIKVFNTDRPGQNSSSVLCCEKILGKYYGQTSLISCFAFPRLQQQLSSSVFAAGCYDNTVGIFDERLPQLSQLLEGHTRGVTCIKFSPCGNFLFSACRRSGEIFCWDLRQVTEPVFSFRMDRAVTTNVKVTFDIDPLGKYLITGNDNGFFSVFDLSSGSNVGNYNTGKKDCINSATFHPYLPYIATCSGERKYISSCDSDSDEDENSSILEYNSISLFHVASQTRFFNTRQ